MIEITDLQNLKTEEFEELVYWILHREGFRNIEWMDKNGTGRGTERGRDIVCRQLVPFGTQRMVYNCVVQCKKYNGFIDQEVLLKDILSASEKGFDFCILATTGVVNEPTKEWLADIEHKFAFKLIFWEGRDIQMLLETHHDLAVRHFSVSMESYHLLKGLSDKYREIASAEKLLLTPVVRKVLTDAYDMSLDYSSHLCTAHLLLSLLLRDRDCTRDLFLSHGLELGRMVKVFEENIIAVQPKLTADQLNYGLRLSFSFRLTLELAIELMNTIQEGAVSERLLLAAILSQSKSGTIDFLMKKCGVDTGELTDELFDRFFVKKEAALLRSHISTFHDSMDMAILKRRLEDTWH